MIYRYTEDNIMALLQCCGTLRTDQIIRFFADEMEANRVQYLLNSLDLEHKITMTEGRAVCSAIGAPELKSEILRRRVAAFWAVANIGSTGVAEVMTIRYPQQFLVITNDGTCYDFSVIESELEAHTAARLMHEALPKRAPDDVVHVAVLTRRSDEEKLRGVLAESGFDSYCRIDLSLNRPVYTSLSGN